jgi:hypothetical protein
LALQRILYRTSEGLRLRLSQKHIGDLTNFECSSMMTNRFAYLVCLF